MQFTVRKNLPFRQTQTCIITTCSVECHWHCSEETVHYKSDEMVIFFGFTCFYKVCFSYIIWCKTWAKVSVVFSHVSGPSEHFTLSAVFFLFHLALCQYDALHYMPGIDEPLVT